MFFYRIAGLTLCSPFELPSYSAFSCAPADADVTLERTDQRPEPGEDRPSGQLVHRRLEDGWFFHCGDPERHGLYVSGDYTRLRLLDDGAEPASRISEWLIRIALECLLARRGFVSLHAAAVEAEDGAYAFTGPSGIGKSTRANAWAQALDATLISGDRPLIDVRNMMLYGVPWDGKEKCFQNRRSPLRAILEVRRSGSVYIRALSASQRRKLLMRQCFLPMWDTETAAVQMANIARLAAGAEMVRIFGGPSGEDASALLEALRRRQILREEADMKVKSGFVLRSVVDEHLVMPTGDNIGVFRGSLLLNDVAALVWEKLSSPVSRDDLLRAILDEYDVEESAAAADLDALLRQLREYDVIEDD